MLAFDTSVASRPLLYFAFFHHSAFNGRGNTRVATCVFAVQIYGILAHGGQHMNRIMVSFLAATTLSVLAGCGGVSEMTKQQVARNEMVVQSATNTVGNSEAGAIELQRAKENLAQAQQAVKAGEEKRAQRLGAQAQLDADLAVAKSQSASARKAADELQASIQQLRQEADRTSTAR
jgi:hypothetical protein